MEITSQSTVSEVATHVPATVRIFQQHEIDFCCGGKRPIADACADRGVDPEALVEELRRAGATGEPERNWSLSPMLDLIAYIQSRFHRPLRTELPRLSQMMARVVERHGARHPDVLGPLQQTLETLSQELLHHMQKEDAILFPAIASLEAGQPALSGAWTWIDGPIDVMEAEHEAAGQALARMRELTRGYAPPDGACPTFRGLYYGLAELEREMHVHIHLENNVLFPRAAELARSR